MNGEQGTLGDIVNRVRFTEGAGGFYESYFLRGNHPRRPLAFWIRYTLFSPRRDPGDTVGELWGVVFDGERSRHRAFKAEIAWRDCKFDRDAFDVRIGEAVLGPGRAEGAIHNRGRALAWSLRYGGDEAPLFLLPRRSYDSAFPAAKALVGLPLARFEGALEIDGERIEVDGWTGSQNHNWGTRHTDRYAWGQVAGFDGYPESFLEAATAMVKIGPLWTPPVTVLVLRHRGREYALNGVRAALSARARVEYFDWTFKSARKGVTIDGGISARRADFVGLRYNNPTGGAKTCLNTKIAACKIAVHDRSSGVRETLETDNRAAFEILTDDTAHGVAVSV